MDTRRCAIKKQNKNFFNLINTLKNDQFFHFIHLFPLPSVWYACIQWFRWHSALLQVMYIMVVVLLSNFFFVFFTRRFGSVKTLTKNYWLFSMGFSQFENDNSKKSLKKYKLFFLPGPSIFFLLLHSVHCSIHVEYGKQSPKRGRRGMFHLFRQPAKEHIKICTRDMLWKGNAYQMS